MPHSEKESEQMHLNVALMDLNMPETNGVETIGRISHINSNAYIVILTSSQGEKDVNKLSKRELEILVHLATGKSNKMIARSAGIEVGTVKFHVNSILSKLNVSSRTEAAIVALRRGLLSIC